MLALHELKAELRVWGLFAVSGRTSVVVRADVPALGIVSGRPGELLSSAAATSESQARL